MFAAAHVNYNGNNNNNVFFFIQIIIISLHLARSRPPRIYNIGKKCAITQHGGQYYIYYE